jgi:DNA-binding IscR family transcriptional regulator
VADTPDKQAVAVAAVMDTLVQALLELLDKATLAEMVLVRGLFMVLAEVVVLAV